jgi:hypothetical protein
MHASTHLPAIAGPTGRTGLQRRLPPIALARLRSALRWAAKVGLVVLMAVASVAVWIGSPLVWLWIASRVADFAHPSMTPYLLLFGGFVITSVVLARVLAAADRAYLALAGAPRRRVHHAWLRASGQQKRERAAGGPVVIVMTISVIAAVICVAVWFVVSGHPFEPVPFLAAH